jgi:hypothetical protein
MNDNTTLELKQEETVEAANSTVSTVTEQPKKRGRKPNPNKKVYFGDEEEEAFMLYIQSTDKTFKDRIFAQKLYYPFTKMVESIIRRYHLFIPDEEFEETFYDTLSFLITKINKFKPDKNKKAFSYCGTICRNYLRFKLQQYSKKLNKKKSFEVVFPTGEISYKNDTNNDAIVDFNTTLINDTVSQLQNMLLPENAYTLNKNEINIGNALLDMLMNWEEIFNYMGSKKFNKSCVLQFLRENTDLKTKDIREGMKKYKELYLFTKKKLIDE